MAEDDPQHKRETVLGALTRFLTGRRRALTEEELLEAISSSEEEGLLDETEGDMLQAIFEFGDTIVREIMVARPDMVCCASDAPLDELLRLILDSGHSRLPIFEGSVDRVVGVVYAKDLLRYWGARSEELSPAAVMRVPYFVPETKRIEDLLVDFRTRRVHMAIVVDEYGGVAGLATIEDVLEQIVGDIDDEYDVGEDESFIRRHADGEFIVKALAPIEDFNEAFGTDFSDAEFDTVGGLLLKAFGRLPERGDTVSLGGLDFEVLNADGRRVHLVKVRAPDREP